MFFSRAFSFALYNQQPKCNYIQNLRSNRVSDYFATVLLQVSIDGTMINGGVTAYKLTKHALAQKALSSSIKLHIFMKKSCEKKYSLALVCVFAG